MKTPRPSLVSKSGPHDVGEIDDAIPPPDCRAVIRMMRTKIDTPAMIETCRKYFSVMPYSTPSGQTSLMNINPPKRAQTAKKTISFMRPMGPPSRGATSSTAVPSTGIVVPGEPGSAAGTVVVTWVWAVKLKDPALPSGSDQFTTQDPFSGTWVRAAEMVTPSADS